MRRIAWMLVVTLVAAWLSSRLRMSSDLSSLFPDRGAAATLSRITRVFGGGDLALVLVEGEDPAEVLAASQATSAELASKPSVAAVVEHAPPRETDPTLAWAFAGPRARERLARALTPDGMRERLAGSKELLLGPTAADAEALLERDPLRLALIPWEERAEIAAGLAIGADGEFVGNGGRARLVAFQAHGDAFESARAHAFVADFESVANGVRAAHPSVTIGLAGGHAVAVATEEMIRGDMYRSATLSSVLVTLAFLFLFPRRRAIFAILPPVMLGGFWTASIGAFFSHGLSAVSVGFAAVVVGVGIDTGVHVYAAVEDARRAGMPPAEAAAHARKITARPVLLAAIAAGACFASLVISELTAMRELGLLCGAGEVLTSVAILGATPEIAAWLERTATTTTTARSAPRWIRAVRSITSTKRRAAIVLASMLAPVVVLASVGFPRVGDAILALRPKTLAPLAVQARIYEVFGGKPGQWIVLTHDTDANAARVRADAIAEALDAKRGTTVDGFDTLASFAPADETVRARIEQRGDLPSKRGDLERALRDGGWDLDALAPALDAFSHPTPAPSIAAPVWAMSRWVGRDAGETLVLTYVRPKDGVPEGVLRDVVLGADPSAVVTGWPLLEGALKESLAHDLPRIAGIAFVLVAIALSASLRTVRDVMLAGATLVLAIAFVLAAMRLLGIGWHVYDALVLPVLLGITMDEAMFLLYAARANERAPGDEALEKQGPLVACTALTTAAGFGALALCRFEGLRDVGVVGAVGSVAGLAASLFVVPAALRVLLR